MQDSDIYDEIRAIRVELTELNARFFKVLGVQDPARLIDSDEISERLKVHKRKLKGLLPTLSQYGMHKRGKKYYMVSSDLDRFINGR